MSTAHWAALRTSVRTRRSDSELLIQGSILARFMHLPGELHPNLSNNLSFAFNLVLMYLVNSNSGNLANRLSIRNSNVNTSRWAYSYTLYTLSIVNQIVKRENSNSSKFELRMVRLEARGDCGKEIGNAVHFLWPVLNSWLLVNIPNWSI